MPTYRVRIKPNTHHGSGRRRHESGEEMIVTEAEVRSFGDKFDVLEEIPDDEPQPIPSAEQVAETARAQAEQVVALLEETFGPAIVEDKVELATVEQLQARMREGDVPPLEDAIGPALAAKLEEHGLGDPITVFYAEDGDLTAVNGIGVGTLRKLRDVYGKV